MASSMLCEVKDIPGHYLFLKFEAMCVLNLATVSGQRVASVQNRAVSQSLLIEIAAWRDLGTEWNDIISRLRPRTVSSGYVYTPWKAGK